MYKECIRKEFGTLQIRGHIRSIEKPDVEITSVDCIVIDLPLQCLITFPQSRLRERFSKCPTISR